MIKYLEKKLKLDLAYFLKGGSWLFFGQIISALKAIIISVFLVRVFGVEDFGKYAYIMAIFSLANIFGAPGMSVAIFQSVSRGYEGTLKYLTKKVFLIGLLGSIFFVFFQLFFNIIQGESNHFIFLALALIFPFYSISANFSYFISGVKKFKHRTLFEFLMNLFIVFSISIAFLIKKDIYFIAIVTVLSQTMIGLPYLLYLIKNSNKEVDYDAYEYGKKLNWNYVIPTIKIQLDRILISNFLGYATTATYNVAFSLSDQVSTFAKILGVLIIPKSSKLTREEIKEKLSFKNISTILLVFFLISTVLIFLIPFIIIKLYGSDFSEAVLFAQIMLFFIPLRCFAQILRNINESQKNIKIINITSNQLSILEIILMVVGLFLFQIWGLIFAKIIADSVGVIWQLAYIYKEKNNNLTFSR